MHYLLRCGISTRSVAVFYGLVGECIGPDLEGLGAQKHNMTDSYLGNRG